MEKDIKKIFEMIEDFSINPRNKRDCIALFSTLRDIEKSKKYIDIYNKFILPTYKK